ncbi:hypothetical protein JCM24511_02089 [Saitozyma sp. JCM 24511]|nr:hypothetical protein JCM24511_02089 [Saitozyma sp. JCM 24511]
MLNPLTKRPIRPLRTTFRSASTWADRPIIPRRAILYVPGSNPNMLAKSLDSAADCVAFDLEDAVAPCKKAEARQLVADVLNLRTKMVSALALPKTTTPDHLSFVVDRINKLAPDKGTGKDKAIRVIAMIENARGMEMIGEIARAAEGHLDALLVCTDFRNDEALRLESEEGRRLGFDGKVGGPPQYYIGLMGTVDISKAARIRYTFELNHKAGKGAYALDGRMIDAPVYKQVSSPKLGYGGKKLIKWKALGVLKLAEAAGVPIPDGKA